MTCTTAQWVERFAALLGVEAPSEEETNELLALAGIAAHASERTAAPVSCWLVAKADISVAEAKSLADELAEALAE